MRLNAECLLSKWGFFDGGLLTEFASERGVDWPLGWDGHALLRALVREYLVPRIAEAGVSVELIDMTTIHNPIRASKVNGIDARPSWTSFEVSELDHLLNPIFVDIPDEVVEARIREEIARL